MGEAARRNDSATEEDGADGAAAEPASGLGDVSNRRGACGGRVAGTDRGVGRRGIADDPEDNTVGRSRNAPVVLVSVQSDGDTPTPFAKPERPGTDELLDRLALDELDVVDPDGARAIDLQL